MKVLVTLIEIEIFFSTRMHCSFCGNSQLKFTDKLYKIIRLEVERSLLTYNNFHSSSRKKSGI